MKRLTLTIAVLLLGALTLGATEWADLTAADQETFVNGCLATAINFEGDASKDGTSTERLALDFIAKPRPQYEKLWQMTRVIDNSSSTCGTVAHTDIDMTTCTADNVRTIVAGPFETLAHAKYPDLPEAQ